MGKFQRGGFGGGDRGGRGGGGGRSFGGRGSFGRGPGGFGGDRPQMFKATCDSCGGTAEVPFRPTGEKPVYCSACFKRDGGGKFGGNDRRDSGRRDFGGDRPSFGGGEKRMFKTICAKCNAETEVPFRPSGDKPAFCRDCFSKVGGRGAGTGAKPTGSAGPSGDVLRSELAALHEKLDLILDALYYDEDEEEDGTVTLEAKPAVKNAPETAVDGKKDGKKDEKKADKKSEKKDGKKASEKPVKAEAVKPAEKKAKSEKKAKATKKK